MDPKRHSDPVSAIFWHDGLARIPADTNRLVRLVSRMILSTRKPQPRSDIRLENGNANQVTGPGTTVACHNHTYSDAFKIESMNSSTNSRQTTSASATSGNLGTRKMNSIPGNITVSTNSANIRANASSTYETYNKRFDSNTPEYLFVSDMASSLDSSIDTNTDHSHLPDRLGDRIASGNMDK
ncbi:hypothetical protein BGX24_004473 [Mortierella sp. AD032]|nr:hypothetical protein BGX24_004473 [Mortierella sp. AD032]